jgi:hypothetical protein
MLHRLLADYSYELLEVEPEVWSALSSASGMDGLNVTIPYKTAVLPLCGALSEDARRTGSGTRCYIKTADIRPQHRPLWLSHAGQPGRDPLAGRKVLILGSGGTSRTVPLRGGGRRRRRDRRGLPERRKPLREPLPALRRAGDRQYDAGGHVSRQRQ